MGVPADMECWDAASQLVFLPRRKREQNLTVTHCGVTPAGSSAGIAPQCKTVSKESSGGKV
jgi:hypothetical protein